MFVTMSSLRKFSGDRRLSDFGYASRKGAKTPSPEEMSFRPQGEIFFWGFRHSCEAGLGDCTAEARRTRSKEFLIEKFSDLCELGASVVNTSSQKTRNNLFFRSLASALGMTGMGS
jgi:hypothetical protein